MATLTIRDLDDDVKRRLRMRAAEKGVSMEAEARSILSDAVADAASAETGAEWLARLRAIFADVGYADDLIQNLPDREAEELIPTSRRIPFVGDPEFDDSVRDDS
ncbi:FitA-like ribbon-helix-helix domain-containing protein [Rathayibacter soli]|uniref:FitA-like ribbon-helix-helix domain-containing protein n=1 Tax=Rathayibacter soli TaxID=3144168 RepID=UPI0027E4311C|nr:hypothetical protein [Glaciibacter superstes]